MSYNPKNPNGQTTSANSEPVVIASDQSAVDVTARGNVASGAADSGNPVKVAGKYNSATPTFTDGQRGDLQLDASGNLKTTVSGGVSIAANSSVNVNQVGGTAIDTNSGVKSAGTQRVVLATDQPQLTNALKVDGSATTQPVSGTVTANAGTGNFATNLAQVAGTTTDTNSGNKSAGTLRVVLATDQPALTTPLPVNISPGTTGGWSVSSQTALTTTATVSGAAGKFGGYMFINLNAAPAYLQVFDTAGAVTLGTTTPTFVIPLPANGTPANGAGANLEMSNGLAIANGIKIAATTTPTGATTVSTAVTGFVLYK